MGLFSKFRDRDRASGQTWFERLVMPRGHAPDPKLEEIKRAATEDVAKMVEEDRKYFDQNSPGNIEDDL